MHKYKCASCGKIFTSAGFADQCPECFCKVLIHLEGEKRSGKKCASCSGHNCASCGGCGLRERRYHYAERAAGITAPPAAAAEDVNRIVPL